VHCTSQKCVICRAVKTLHFKSGKFNLTKQHNESISNSLLESLIKKHVIHDGVVCVSWQQDTQDKLTHWQ